MNVRVRDGYTLFIKDVCYLGGTILTVTEEDIKGQEWKVEPVELNLENKELTSKTTKNRMIKKKETTTK